jgi:hypothetical protein
MSTTDDEIKVAVDQAYKKKYKTVEGVKVTHIARGLLPGEVVVVECKESDGDGPPGSGEQWEELCYLDDKGVQIFDTTEQLVEALLKASTETDSLQNLNNRRETLQKERAQATRLQITAVVFGMLCLGSAVYFALAAKSGVLLFLSATYSLGSFAMLPVARMRRHEAEADLQEIEYKIDLQRFQVSPSETRAEKILRLNDLQLRRYYESTLRQNGWVFWLGIFCIVLGVGVSAFTLWLVAWPHNSKVVPQLGDKIVTAALGAVGSLLTNYVAVIYLKMHASATSAMMTFHERLVATHQTLFGNLVASRITDDKLRWDTLAKIALNVSGAAHLSKTKSLSSEKSNGQRRASLARDKQTASGGKLKTRTGGSE